jgi:hypothetical protein
MKKYKVTLTPDERQQLEKLIAAGNAEAKRLAHSRILRKADAAEGELAWSDSRIAKAIAVTTDTVARIREHFVEQGMEAALVCKKQDKPSRERVLDGRAEAKLIVLACSAAPGVANPGRGNLWPTRWSSGRSSIRFLTRRCVAFSKKTKSSRD